jgi:hypothetical protein
MSRHDTPRDDSAGIGRRHLLQLGGVTAAAGALLAACSHPSADSLGRVGLAPTTTKLPDAIVDDSVYLRTAASMERSIVGVYDRVLAAGTLLDVADVAAAQRFRADHLDQSLAFDLLTIGAGGKAYTAKNPRMETTIVTPVFNAILGAKSSTPDGTDTPPSDDPKRDTLHFLYALETIAAQSYQSFVPLLSVPNLRVGVVQAATAAAHRSSIVAIMSTGRPDGYIIPSGLPPAVAVTTTVATTTTVAQNIAATAPTTTAPASPPTPIPRNYAITTQFGSLAPIALVVGAPNDGGTRTTINLDTPSLNTFVYEYMEPAAS